MRTTDGRRGTLATRALKALYRNHPSTAPGDRYGEKAGRRAHGQRAMLLAWAADLPDYRLLDCRNLGTASLAWIRAHQAEAMTEQTTAYGSAAWTVCPACGQVTQIFGRVPGPTLDVDRLARAITNYELPTPSKAPSYNDAKREVAAAIARAYREDSE